MICRVGISSSAVAPIEGARARELVALHHSLGDQLLNHGVLFFRDAKDTEELREEVARLGSAAPAAAKMWEELLIELTRRRRTRTSSGCLFPLSQLGELDSLEGSGWCDQIEIAVVDDDQAELLDLPDDVSFLVHAESELRIVPPGQVAMCDLLQAISKRMRSSTVPKGADRQEVWKEWFAPIIRDSKRLTIHDRYLVHGVERGGDDSALRWILDGVSKAGSVERIEFFCAEPEDQLRGRRPEDQVKALTDLLSVGWDFELELHVAPREGNLKHDRHLASDLGCVLEFSAGLDRFNGPLLSEATSIVYGSQPESVRKARDSERHAREHSRLWPLD